MAHKLIFLALIVLLFSSLVLAEKKVAKVEAKREGYNAEHHEEEKGYKNHEEEEEKGYKNHEEDHDEEKGYKNHEEEKGYKGGKKHRINNRITSAKWYKFCTYVAADTNCTERASCAILENQQCHTLLDGYSVYLSVVGKSYVLLRFKDTECTTQTTETLAQTYNYDLKDSTIDECQAVTAAPSLAGLNYVVSPLRRTGNY